MTGIYCIENKINKKQYIGQSIDINKRIKRHFSELRKGSHHNRHLQFSFNKYGENNFTSKILELCPEDDLNKREIYWIEQNKSYSEGYNETIGGAE